MTSEEKSEDIERRLRETGEALDKSTRELRALIQELKKRYNDFPENGDDDGLAGVREPVKK